MTGDGFRECVMVAGLALLACIIIPIAGCVIAALARCVARKLKGASPTARAVAIIGACVAILYGGSKPSGVLEVVWDDYLQGSGQADTNTWASATFTWTKTNAAMPDSTPLYISKKPMTLGSDWTLAATTTVGASPYTLTIAQPSNYQYWVWHNWEPPVPVHTNGVWLGNVLEKTKNGTGVDKLLIINGKLLEYGVEIAPKKGN